MYRNEEELPEFDPNEKYTGAQLDAYAEKLLREDARSEICRDCSQRGIDTGEVSEIEQEAVDGEGNPLIVAFPQYTCKNGHKWYAGEGSMKGIGGDNPILFKEHFDSRKRREIYTACGTPDPEIVSGIYNRTHPQGRKVNSEEQRKRNGASFFRAYMPPPVFSLELMVVYALFISVVLTCNWYANRRRACSTRTVHERVLR